MKYDASRTRDGKMTFDAMIAKGTDGFRKNFGPSLSGVDWVGGHNREGYPHGECEWLPFKT